MNKSHFLLMLGVTISCLLMNGFGEYTVSFQLRGAVTLQVQNEAKTPLKKFLLNLAVASKFSEVKKGIIRRDSLWDKLIFRKIQVCWVGPDGARYVSGLPSASAYFAFPLMVKRLFNWRPFGTFCVHSTFRDLSQTTLPLKGFGQNAESGFFLGSSTFILLGGLLRVLSNLKGPTIQIVWGNVKKKKIAGLVPAVDGGDHKGQHFKFFSTMMDPF